MSTRGRVITFLTREGCTLCDEALHNLRVPSALLGVEVQPVDVDGAQDLADGFGSRVPVMLAADGEVLAEGSISRGEAWRATWRARRPG